jgi:hypothetical protein
VEECPDFKLQCHKKKEFIYIHTYTETHTHTHTHTHHTYGFRVVILKSTKNYVKDHIKRTLELMCRGSIKMKIKNNNRGREDKGERQRSEFKMNYKHFWKCHNVPPGQ